MLQREADKRSIAKTVKELYSVTVISVSTVTIPQKGRRFGRRAKLVSGSPTKKAIVKLAPGQTLSLFESGSQKEHQVGGKQP